MAKQSIDEKTKPRALELSDIDSVKRSASRFVREQWIKRDFDFDASEQDARVQDEYFPKSDEPPKVGCLLYSVPLVIGAISFSIANLVLEWFPDLSKYTVYLFAIGAVLPFIIGVNQSTEERSAWEQNEKLRKEVSSIFLREVEAVTQQARDRMHGSTSFESLTEQQIRMLFAPPPLVDCTPKQAELWARDWMRFLGAEDAQVTQATRDGGLDVHSKFYVVQVKHYAKPVGPGPVREIAGVAGSMSKQGMFFAQNGYTKAAREFGRDADIILFSYDTYKGELIAHTELSERVLRNGLE